MLITLLSFSITIDRISYFITNNATNNNTYLKDLASSLSFNYSERQVRYASYVINLIAYVIL